jgi:hypothetical protein
MNPDEIFTQIAGRAGSLDVLLHQFFGFLNRRTDLYVTFDPTKENAKMGFPEGIAEKMVLQSMHKFPFRKLSDQEGASGPPPSSPASAKKSGASIGGASTSSAPSSKTTPAATALAPTLTASETRLPPAPSPISTQEASGAGMKAKRTADGKLVPINNGGFTDKYYWTQSLEEVTVYVEVPTGTRGKDVVCDIHSQRMALAVGGKAWMQGNLDGTVSVDDSMWTLSADDACTVVIIHLEKRKHTWWSCILEGDDEIDTSQVDSTRKVADYDESTQATIRKIMHDEKQKRLGLPTSEDERMDGILEQAKGLPGSPFLK